VPVASSISRFPLPAHSRLKPLTVAGLASVNDHHAIKARAGRGYSIAAGATLAGFRGVNHLDVSSASMTIRCPQCVSVASLSASDLDPAGSMIRCETCGTRWLARRFADDPYERPALQRVMPTPMEIADAVVIEHVGPAFRRLPPPHRREIPSSRELPRDRRALKIFGTIFGALVGIVLLRAPIVAAFPVLNGLPAEVAQLEFQRVRSETVHLGSLSTLFVEGEIVNRSVSDVSLPAIRITLRSPGGGAVTSWLVEPSVTGLAAGRSIGFRSALASPPDDATQVTLNLAAREGVARP
jgi:predicted Zn finger-like uncharacterized protein